MGYQCPDVFFTDVGRLSARDEISHHPGEAMRVIVEREVAGILKDFDLGIRHQLGRVVGVTEEDADALFTDDFF